MNRLRHSFLILAALLAAGSPLPTLSESRTMTDTASATATQPAITTFCLGHFLIDMPAGSRFSGGNYKYRFGYVEKPQKMGREQYEQEMKALEDKLRTTKHEKDPSLLRAMEKPDAQSAIIAHWEEFGSAGIVKVHGYKWDNGIRFLIRNEAGMGMIPDGSKTMQESAIGKMRATLAGLRTRPDSEIPSEPGYCFEGGFIANPKWQNEEVNVDIDIAGHPGAFVTVWYYPRAAEKRGKPLLERMGGAVQQLGNFATAVRSLRQGERTVGGFKGQEYLVTAPNSGGLRGHLFKWETQGEGTDQEPRTVIELQTGHHDNNGNAQQTKLSDKEAMQLWDRILDSFRLRPTSDPAKHSEAPTPLPKTPLGELAATGRLCPETGWWRCADEGAPVVGGSRLYFRLGERMPDVVLQGEANLWQKVTGETPQFRRATVWTLSAYPDAPQEVPSGAEAAAAPNADAAGAALPDLVPPAPTEPA